MRVIGGLRPIHRSCGKSRQCVPGMVATSLEALLDLA